MLLIYILMGVSGSGKTTTGRALAERLAIPFYDGDDFHPAENIAKMSQGIPLDDRDRQPWLDRLQHLITTHLQKGEAAVIACSALKRSYRQHLSQGDPRVQFIYLQGDFDLIWQRMVNRQTHYMQANMLKSQFRALEEPSGGEAIFIAIDEDPEGIVGTIIEQITTNP